MCQAIHQWALIKQQQIKKYSIPMDLPLGKARQTNVIKKTVSESKNMQVI